MRKNKTKPEIVRDIKATQEADRKRAIVREKVFPFLLELNDTIGYTKIFLQTASVGVENVFQDKQKEVKVSDILPRLREVFKGEDSRKPEMEKYVRLFEILQDETIHSFRSMIQEMPRAIEGYFTKETDKHPILDAPIEKILG